jgi:L-alanine-DL-glutamate epimerase-like enolase superfamily enzyme
MADIVEQADRNAAAAYLKSQGIGTFKTWQDRKSGKHDNSYIVQAFTRHRLAERTRLFTLLREHAGDADILANQQALTPSNMCWPAKA